MSWFRKILEATSATTDDIGVAVSGGPSRDVTRKLSQFFYAGCFLSHLTRIECGMKNGSGLRAAGLLDAIWSELEVPSHSLSASFSYDTFRSKALAYDEGLVTLFDAARCSHDLRRWLISLGWRYLLDSGRSADLALETVKRVGSDMGMTEADIAASSSPYIRSAADGLSLESSRSLLKVGRGASRAEIRGAFRSLVRTYHPDRHSLADPALKDLAQERFVLIRDAYDRLMASNASGGNTLYGLALGGGMVAQPDDRVICFQCNMPQRLRHEIPRVEARCDRCRAFLTFERPVADRFRQQWMSCYGHTVSGNGRAVPRAARSSNGASGAAAKLFATGVTHLRSERFSEAAAAFGKAVSKDSGHATAQFNLGVCLGRLDRHEEAIEAFQQTIRLAPFHVTAHVNLGLSFSHLDRNEDAIDPFRRAIHLDGQHGPAHLNLGLAMWRLGRGSEAVAAMEEAVRLKPDDAAGHRLLGCVYMAMEQTEAAAESFRRAVSLDGTQAATYVNLGMCCGVLGLVEEALSAFGEAVRISPDDEVGLLRLGQTRMLSGQYESAIEALDRALSLKDAPAAAVYDRGLCLAKLGRFEEASRSFEAAAVDHPDDVVYRLLGAARFELGDIAGAVKAFREAVSLAPDHAKGWLNLGCCLAGQGDHAAAIDPLTEAVRLDENLVDAHFQLGLSLGREGRLDESLAAFEVVVRVDPNRATVHRAVGRCCLLAKRFDDALSAVDRGLKLDSADGAGHRLRGAVLMSLERIDDAMDAFRRAVALDSGDVAAAKMLERATKMLERAESAIEQAMAGTDGVE